MNTTELLTWHPTSDEVRRIVVEMRPILEASAAAANRQLEAARP